MIEYKRFAFENGLKVLIHEDPYALMATVNVLYDVGARDESPDKTGFAHLFEHLMFGGSVNIPDYDRVVQEAGGENNAFTSNDLTNYYITLPASNLETAFWLESDRMLELAFSQQSLDIQRNVVIEEFKQRYLNQPYGDVWLLLRPLMYKQHPYSWPTIGKDISHIEQAVLEDVRQFFFSHYAPNNAILSVAGNVDTAQVLDLAQKWFGTIGARPLASRTIQPEPPQNEMRKLVHTANVPYNALFMGFHACARAHSDFHATDLIGDLLSNGKSSRLVKKWTYDTPLFSQIEAYYMPGIDSGMFVVAAYLLEDTTHEQAEEIVFSELNELAANGPENNELQKVKNRAESMLIFNDIPNFNKAYNLAFYELLGNAALYNSEPESYQNVESRDIQRVASAIFKPENCSILYYKVAPTNP